VLRRQLARLNRWQMDDPRIDALLRRLRLLPATLEGNEQFLHALRNQWTAYDPAAQREFNVIFIDYDNLTANEFHFTEEMWVLDKDRRRLDMVLFVNGLPVTLIENKSPRLEDPGKEGFDQVQTTYTTWIPNFVRFPVPFVVAASRLEYGPTWNPSVKAFYTWKTNDRDYGLEGLANTFFERSFHLRLLRDYTLFYRIDDATQKYLLRPHQMRTVEKVVERVVKGVADVTSPNSGLEWHTQGSGKTLTMIVAAHLLRRQPELDNPTILIVVDRLDLESQMLAESAKPLACPPVRADEAHNTWRTCSAADTRGVIVTTIHKFDGIRQRILTRRTVIVLVDEAHRSQEGDLGIDMRAALPNAFRSSASPARPSTAARWARAPSSTFGSPADPAGYHDKYSINESIDDGTTAPALLHPGAHAVVARPRHARPASSASCWQSSTNWWTRRAPVQQEALSRLLQRADKLMAVLKSPSPHRRHREAPSDNTSRSTSTRWDFKAIVVAPDREACMLYKQALGPTPARRLVGRRLLRQPQEGQRRDAGALSG
jgi:type I restriction enzyme R subunit